MLKISIRCFAAGQHAGGSKPGNEAAQKSLDRRAAHLILRGARELLTSRAADLKAQVAQFNQVLGANPGQAGNSPNSTQKMTPVSLPPLPSPLTSPTVTPVVLPTEVRPTNLHYWGGGGDSEGEIYPREGWGCLRLI